MSRKSLIEESEDNRDVLRKPANLECNREIGHVVIDRRDHGKSIVDAGGFESARIARIARNNSVDGELGSRLAIGRDDPEWNIQPSQDPGDANADLSEAAED